MPATARREHWDAIYKQRGEGGVSWFQEVPRRSLELITRYAPPPAQIIDVGGGASRLVDGLLCAGYSEITVADVSPVALALSRERLQDLAGQVDWIEADITGSPALPETDLWHDRAVFHFLTDEGDRRGYVELAARTVRPGGTLVIATFALDGPEQCSGLPVQRSGPQDLVAALAPHFTLLEAQREQHATPGGAVQAFTYAVFRRSR
jgi:SAM-dependent methyltransferase